MAFLHTVNKSLTVNPALRSCLAVAEDNSVLLLLEDGVYNAVAGSDAATLVRQHCFRLSVKVLQPDVHARGLTTRLLAEITPISDTDFVALAARLDGMIAWF